MYYNVTELKIQDKQQRWVKRGGSMKYFYPAVFTLDEEKNQFHAVFPDLTGCAVKAGTIEETARKAREALGMALWELEEKSIEVPPASDEYMLRKEYRNCQVCMILLDMDEYRAFREYRMEQAERDTAAWAESARKRRGSLLQKVFGTR